MIVVLDKSGNVIGKYRENTIRVCLRKKAVEIVDSLGNSIIYSVRVIDMEKFLSIINSKKK